MPTMKIGDINIYHEIHGEGEPLVLIMGLGADSSRWFRIVPIFSKEYRVITFDNRGVGESSKPDIPYTMEMMADDTAGLLDAIGIDTAHVFGVSMGGMIAQHFALRHPQMTSSLILGCTRCGGPHSITEETGATGVLAPDLIETMTAEDRARALLPFLFSREFIENNPVAIEENIALQVEHPIDPISYARQLQAANGHDTYDRLPDITAPTLVITGEADRLISSENSRILASRIPGAELVMLEKAGHGFHTEAMDETCRTVIDFMKRYRQS